MWVACSCILEVSLRVRERWGKDEPASLSKCWISPSNVIGGLSGLYLLNGWPVLSIKNWKIKQRSGWC